MSQTYEESIGLLAPQTDYLVEMQEPVIRLQSRIQVVGVCISLASHAPRYFTQIII